MALLPQIRIGPQDGNPPLDYHARSADRITRDCNAARR
ncbi:hypothetical protein [Azospirillum largimobile]